MSSSIAHIGENALLGKILPLLAQNEGLFVSAGDDCAVVHRDEKWDTLLKTDAIVESIHFLPQTEGKLIGRKALARAISDIAAMGGIPEHALVSIFVHPSRSIEHILAIYDGLNELAKQYGISIAGGETSSLPYDGLILNISLSGKIEHQTAILRSGAKEGDLIAVSGCLGNSFDSQHHLNFTPRVALARALHASQIPHAMMDLSDGLGTDLPRLASASCLGFIIEEDKLPLRGTATPQQAISDGEDYELLFTFPEKRLSDIEKISLQFPESPLHIIGNMTAHTAQNISSGWQHFRH